MHSGELAEKYGAEVSDFQYAFVLSGHVPGSEENTVDPVNAEAAIARAAIEEALASGRRLRKGPRKPARFIEIKPKA